ncbi:MAG: response regulator [Bacteroidia bacterium]|nr:response regulator [Bacteroidia bacterium]
MTYRFPSALLIDDNEIDNFINERIINTSGFAEEIIVKTSTDEALEFLKGCEQNPASMPPVIFLDLNMPVKDGFVFLEEFNKLSDLVKSKSKVVVLSASISPDDINKASANPYVIRYLNKPLSEKYLEAITF